MTRTREGMDPTIDRINEVNWDDPRVRDLLAKADTLKLDKRGTYSPRVVGLRHTRNGITSTSPALLVSEGAGGTMTIVTDFPLEGSEHVTMDKERELPGHPLLLLCRVQNTRLGIRHDDVGRAVFVSDLQLQRVLDASSAPGPG